MCSAVIRERLEIAYRSGSGPRFLMVDCHHTSPLTVSHIAWLVIFTWGFGLLPDSAWWRILIMDGKRVASGVV